MSFYSLYAVMIALYGIGVMSAFANKTYAKTVNIVAHSIAAAGSLAAILCAINVFFEGTKSAKAANGLLFGLMTVRIDALAAYFMLAVGLVGTVTSIYAIGYAKEYYANRLSTMTGLWNGFLLSMMLVLTVNNIFAFLVAWELMTVLSFMLVNHDYQKRGTTRAAYYYIVMTNIGTAFIVVAFLILSVNAGSLDFTDLTALGMNDTLKSIVFLCALVGFGTKAGIMPLHIWLPKAHPAAPTHVSAVMSGVMIKTAVYGICRFVLDFLGTGPAWWGILIMVIAIITSVMGILYALMEKDIKRLLAYSSVENMGIILLGVGAAMVFMSKKLPIYAGLAWMAAMLHLLNHAIFKSLLFMGAGAILSNTHTKNMEKLGGLLKNMPCTGLFCLIGAAAIAALPPLNGFYGELLTFQSLFFLTQALPGLGGKVFAALLIAMLGLTGAMAAACFVKTFGITFLGKPRSKHAEEVSEASSWMLISMGFMALLCCILGVMPQIVLSLIDWVFLGFNNVDTIGVRSVGNMIQMPVELGFIIIGVFVAGTIMAVRGRTRTEAGETWTCGIVPTARMEYSATGFSKPIRQAFRSILKPQREQIYTGNAHGYYGRKLHYKVTISDLFIEKIYLPIRECIFRTSRILKKIQAGSVQAYISYILVVTLAVLMWSVGW